MIKNLFRNPVRVLAVIVLAMQFGLLGYLLTDALKERDDMSDLIRQALLEYGYAVENVDFDYVSGDWETAEQIYKSSEPVYFNGRMVDHWVVFLYSINPGAPMHLSVRPYIPQATATFLSAAPRASQSARI